MIKKLMACIREYKRPTLLTFLFIVGEVIIECLIPFITANLVNQMKADMEMKTLLTIGISLVVMALVSLCCGGLAGYTSAKASAGFAKNLRHDLFDKIQNFSFQNIDKFSSSSLVTRLTTDVSNVQMSYMMLIRTAIRSPLMFIFSIIMAYIMGGALATTFVVVIPVLAVGLILVTRKAMPAFRSVFKKYDKLNESIEENVRAMRVVKGFAREDYEIQKFGKAAGDICADFTKAERIVAFNNPLMQACLYFNMLFVLTIGSKLVIESMGASLDVGQISSMLTYGMQILMSLMMISMIYVMVTMSFESMKRIDEVLSEQSSLVSPAEAVTEVKDGSIDFNGVSFKYSEKADRYALSDIDLHIRSGMTVGIIGGTGSSKSSLVQLIPRLYDASEGSVLVGGVDVKKYDLVTLRDSVAMVLQKNLLFSGTIEENLRWGNENATDEEIYEACKLAQADEFISTLPNGYDTYIEQGGTNVSGGQKQRLCIARALLKKPKILILDDSTSAVDTKTDALIRKGFADFIPETTKIIIAQRISSVQNADLIIIMNNGTIADMGSHDELMRTSEIYREIFEEQTHGGADDETDE
ncbi:MAG TPA: ABC transporter ATP-binding protein [Candidatus Merdivicinus faecavium]|nr:ABC transporter ATP-binding protein [Candidatus Merdivicinus faecavium]